MARSSSRHKREIQGKDSAGQTAPEFGEKPNIGKVPQWLTVPPLSGSVPNVIDMGVYVSSDFGALRNWSISSDDNVNITIDQTGTAIFGAGLSLGVHPVSVTVANDIGAATSNGFTFEATV
jgi:hypothetical protein